MAFPIGLPDPLRGGDFHLDYEPARISAVAGDAGPQR